MNRACTGGIALPLILAIIIILLPREAGTLSQNNRTGWIKINILSKHLRLMKESGSGGLTFTLTPGTVVRYDDRELFSGRLEISHNGAYSVRAGDRSINFSRCIVYSDTHSTLCRVKVDGEDRTYPLPLEILREGEELKIYVTENREQYAVDSASAELGYVKTEESEALYALALAIHGRCGVASLKKKHRGCDFCDLTCCQSYRGRSGRAPVEGGVIDAEKTGCGLFFHSSSGGRLFSEAVFNSGGRKIKPPADIIYSRNILLSRNLHRSWEAVLGREEAAGILFPGHKPNILGIRYNPMKEIVILSTDRGEMPLAPEEFRLKVNRRKGWNFIRSNNYALSEENVTYVFRGYGLGHCTGMSMDGALELASMGYSRYEILEHYYPGLKYKNSHGQGRSFQYLTYNPASGKVIYSSTGRAFSERRIPCGSIFKLFTVIYLAQERSDLFHNHKFTCDSHNPFPLPVQCWERSGHGEMNTGSAIYSSCNIFFASLHDRISREDFTKWFEKFTEENGISMHLPAIKNEKEWCELLAGLDFRAELSVRDLIKLSMYIHSGGNGRIPEGAMDVISDSLHKTFTHGTARVTGEDPPLKVLPADLWGKTGTVISGTNSHFSYGLFTGGSGDRGIITLVRKGKGADAAHLSIDLLKKEN